MRKLGLLTIILLTLVNISFGQNSNLVWTKPTSGKNYQLFSIKQPNGEFIGICRASYQGGIYPGKLVNKKCNIGFGGKEIVMTDFEVFEPQENPNIKINDSWKGTQFLVGYESNGQKIFLCYAIYQNAYHPGKSVDGKCFFTQNGNEIQATSFLNYFYEVTSGTQTSVSPSPTPTPQSKLSPVEAEKAARATEFLNNAIYNFRGNKFEAAVADFTEYIKIYPNNAEGYYNRGVTYRNWGKSALAIADFEQALKLKPDFAQAKTELDKLKQTKTEEIVTSISQIIDVKPTDEFYKDLQSLIEKYGISKVTIGKKFNPDKQLTMFEYADFIKQGKEYLKMAASGFGIKEIDEEKLFNSKCTLPYLSLIPEKEIAKSLSCNYRIKNFSMPGGENWITRGKFAIYFNKALQQATLEYSLNNQAESVTNDLFSSSSKTADKKVADEKSEEETREEKEVVAKAEKDLNECLKKSRKCYFERAFLASMKDDYSNALTQINLAIAAEPKNFRYLSFRADLYLYDLSDYQKAWNDFTTLIRLEPKNGLWYRDRAYTACQIPKLKNTAKQDEAKAIALGTKIGSPCK